MAEQDSMEMNPEWEKVAGGFARKIVARHHPMVQRIMVRATAPVRRMGLWRAAERFFPRIAREIADKARWSRALAGRVSALSERIGRAFESSELRAEPIERVWLEEGPAFESPPFEEPLGAAGIETRPAGVPSPPAPEPAGESRAGGEPRRRRVEPDLVPRPPQMPAPAVQRSPLGRTLHFAAQAHTRLERVPLVGFSRPALEGLGVLTPRGPGAERTPSRPPFRRGIEESAEREIPWPSVPLPRTPEVRPEEAPPASGRLIEMPGPPPGASAEAVRIVSPVARYIQRAREPFLPIRRKAGAAVAAGEGMAARPAAFEGIVRKAPVTVGFTPPIEAAATESPISRPFEALPVIPLGRAPSPASEAIGETPGEPAPPFPFRPQMGTRPPEQPLARKPVEPVRLRGMEERGWGESAPVPPPRRGPAPIRERPEIPIADVSASRVPMKAVPPPSGKPRPAVGRSEGKEEGVRAPMPEESSRWERKPPPPAAARAAQRSAAPKAESAEEFLERAAQPQRAETAVGRKSELPEEAPPIVEMPDHRERPAVSGTGRRAAERIERDSVREEKAIGPPLPVEALPSLAETVRSRYEPPRGVRRIQRVPLPVSSQRAFASIFGRGIVRTVPGSTGEREPGAAERPAGFEALPFAGLAPPMPVSLSSRGGLFRKPAPAQRIPLPLASGTGASRGESEPLGVPVIQRGETEIERGGGADLVSALYRKPVSVGPKAKGAGKTTESIARTAEAPATASAAGRPAEGAAPASEQASAESPDLDAIAREVYAIIRRRLAIERERLGR